MATRSNIGILNSNGTINSIYCHWDGYPSNNGKILLEYYQDTEKIKKLINGGDISYLGEEISGDKNHTFDNPSSNQTVFYTRDRGENTPFKVTPLKSFHQEEFSYYWDGTNWLYSSNGKKYHILTKEDYNDD